MASAQGVKRKIVIAKETTFGAKVTATDGKIIPRTESSLNSNFDSFASSEIHENMQRSPSIVGFEKVEGCFLRLHCVAHGRWQKKLLSRKPLPVQEKNKEKFSLCQRKITQPTHTPSRISFQILG